MTRLLKSVEALELVKRTSNKKDKRQKVVCLTVSGKALMKDLTGLAQTTLKEAQKDIDPTNIAICKEVLTQINETLSRELTKST